MHKRPPRLSWVAGISILFLAGLIVGAALFALRSPGAGPKYGGKHLTVWIEEYRHLRLAPRGPDTDEKTGEALRAIRAIGTNAVPTLLDMVAASDSKPKLKFMELLKKQRIITLNLQPADYYRSRATFGFGALGDAARPAIPGLIDLLSDPDPGVRASAAHCLSFFGPDAREAVPHLIGLLKNTGRSEPLILLNSMHALGAIHVDAETVVPFLLEYTEGAKGDWGYGNMALRAVSRYRTSAAFAVPEIVALLDDPDERVRDAADTALGWLDPDGTLRRQHQR